LREAHRLVEQARGRERLVTVVVVTDGRATAANGEARAAFADAVDAAGALAAAGVQLVVVDCEQGPTRLGMAQRFAEQIGAAHLPLSQFDRLVTDGRTVAGLTPPVAQPHQEHPHAGT
jgi:magnesium chelatase subunit D